MGDGKVIEMASRRRGRLPAKVAAPIDCDGLISDHEARGDLSGLAELARGLNRLATDQRDLVAALTDLLHNTSHFDRIQLEQLTALKRELDASQDEATVALVASCLGRAIENMQEMLGDRMQFLGRD